MDARLLYARKLPVENGSKYEWRIIHPKKRGIRVRIDGTPATTVTLFNISAEVLAFLTDIMGEDGLWQGW